MPLHAGRTTARHEGRNGGRTGNKSPYLAKNESARDVRKCLAQEKMLIKSYRGKSLKRRE